MNREQTAYALQAAAARAERYEEALRTIYFNAARLNRGESVICHGILRTIEAVWPKGRLHELSDALEGLDEEWAKAARKSLNFWAQENAE